MTRLRSASGATQEVTEPAELRLRLRRVVCVLRGHRVVTVFDRVQLTDAGPAGVAGRVLASHKECRRCTRNL